jgi:hypothetical protein
MEVHKFDIRKSKLVRLCFDEYLKQKEILRSEKEKLEQSKNDDSELIRKITDELNLIQHMSIEK